MKPGSSLILVPTGAESESAPRSAVKPRFREESLVAARASAAIAAARSPAAIPDHGPASNEHKLARMAATMDPKNQEFPKTKWSLVHAGAESPEALRELCRIYRAPLEAFARRIESDPAGAQDLVQGFLIHMLEQKVVRHAHESQGRFRSYLRSALHHYAINVYRKHERERRLTSPMPDFDTLASNAPAADRSYDRAWARSLLDRALQRLRDEQQARPDKGAVFEALAERLEGDDGGATLLEAANKLGKSEGAVKLSLFRLRRRYFELVRAEVGPTVARPEDVDAELFDLRAALRDER